MTAHKPSVIIIFEHKHTNYYLAPLLFCYAHTTYEIYNI